MAKFSITLFPSQQAKKLSFKFQKGLLGTVPRFGECLNLNILSKSHLAENTVKTLAIKSK